MKMLYMEGTARFKKMLLNSTMVGLCTLKYN